MSGGQALGGIVGGAIGFFAGGGFTGAKYGAQLGMMIGGYLDPPQTDLKSPGPGDLTQQTSTYGAPIPRIYSRVAVTGNVIWLEKDKLKAKSSDTGGVTTYTYYATFAVGLCKGPIACIGRIWIGSDLVYDPFATTLKAIQKSKKFLQKITIYLGTDDQEPDAAIQADRGVANTPAYRGLCYIKLTKLKLTKYGNSLSGAPVKVELFKEVGSEFGLTLIDSVETTNEQIGGYNGTYGPKPYFMSSDKTVFYVPNWSEPSYEGATFYKYIIDNSHGYFSQAVTIDHTADDFPPWGTGNKKKHYWQGATFLFGPGVAAGDNHFKHINKWNVGISSTSIYLAKDISKYNPQTLSSTSSSVVIDVGTGKAITIDESGVYIYVACDDGVRVYDINLTLVSFTAYTFAGLTVSASRVSLYNGILYIFVSGVGGSIWSYNITTKAIAFEGTLPAPETLPGVPVEVIVDDELIIRAYSDDSPTMKLAVQWFYINGVIGGYQALSEIVLSECLQSNLIQESDVDVSELTQIVSGFKVSDIGPIRGALAQLQAPWPFDVYQSGYTIKFIPRGQESIADISIDDLAIDKQLSQEREMDSQIPKKVVLKYLEADREFDLNEQYAERLNTDAVNVSEIVLSVVLGADEAAQTAEKLLYLYWLERVSFNFYLPPPYRYLEPSDVVTIDADYATYELRLTQISYDTDGRLNCKAKPNNVSVYTSSATGSVGEGTGGEIITDVYESYYSLLDIPCLTEDNDKPGFWGAMTGDDDGWPGGNILRSTNEGVSYSIFDSFANQVDIAIAIDTITTPVRGIDLIDPISVLTVNILAGTFSSVSQLSMLSGANYFAYGAHGRWEIIAAQNCDLQVDGSYQLTNLLRGRFGTAHNVANHAIGDYLILLTDEDIQFSTVSSSSIGVEYEYRGITFGAELDSDDDFSFTYSGVNLKPLAPVLPHGYRDAANNDFYISWTRQDRLGTSWPNFVAIPMSEASESYKVEIYNSDYSTLKRTITSSTEACTYTAAQQTTDFGSLQTLIYFKVYQYSSVVGWGYPLTTTLSRPIKRALPITPASYTTTFFDVDLNKTRPMDITPASYVTTFADVTLTRADPQFSYVKSLLHFNGADGSTTFTDVTGKTWTAVSPAQIDTAQSVFGGASGLFDGVTAAIYTADHADWEIGGGDFEEELRVTFNALPSPGEIVVLLQKGLAASSNSSYAFQLRNTAGVMQLYFLSSTSGAGATTTNVSNDITSIITTGVPYKLGVSRSGSTITFFFEGATQGTATNSETFFNGSADVYMGSNSAGLNLLNGWIDEHRFTNGYCRHTATHAVESSPFPDQ